jgi:aspartyl/asparaginyl beta-hydroxylase (cupin superfamily)
MRAGKAALESGDALAARRHFDSILAAGLGDAPACIMLAIACQKLGDMEAVQKAIDTALSHDPRNIHALLMKAERLAATGNTRVAAQFYGAAVALASQVKDLPPMLVDFVRHAAEARDRIGAHFEAHLRDGLGAGAGEMLAASPRFERSVGMVAGNRQVYGQQPRDYYFPELPQVQFYPRDQVAWLDAVEAAANEIRGELKAVLLRDRGLVPRIQDRRDVPHGDTHGLMDSLDWSAFYLCRDGVTVEENAAQCPRTMAALANAPLPRIKGREPSVFFSVLKPRLHVAAHHGRLNTMLTCHLPLEVPAGASLRVGDDQREWRYGKAWAFDDSIEHEWRNPGDGTLSVLSFDVWRPEISEQERRAVAALLEAMDSYGAGPRVEWTR